MALNRALQVTIILSAALWPKKPKSIMETCRGRVTGRAMLGLGIGTGEGAVSR